MVFLISNGISSRTSKLGLILVSFFSLVVVILIGLAIYFYPDDYGFFSNYLSDLGVKTTSPHGYDNATSSLLFSSAMFLSGILSFIFWVLSQNVIRFKVSLNESYKKIVVLGAIIGAISSIFNFLIGIFPYDTEHDKHLLVGVIFFGLGGLACFIYALLFVYLFFRDKSEEKVLLYSLITVAITILVAVLILLFLNETSSAILIGILVIIIILNLILMVKFQNLISYLSYIVSFSIITLEALIVLLLIQGGLKPVLEVSVILGITAFLMTNNLKLLTME